ncbi:MAG: DUF4403 family protein, partial [Myxococcota bacterium]
MALYTLVVFSSPLLFLMGCFSWSEPVQGPPRGALLEQAPEDDAQSVVSVPISLSLAELGEAIDKQLPPVLVQETGKPIKNNLLLDLTVRRRGALTMQPAGRKLRILVPLAFDARAVNARRAERGKAGKGTQATGAMMMKIDLALSITPKWQMRSEATVRYDWIDKPRVKVGPFNVNITKPVDAQLQKQLPEIAQQIEARVAEQDRLPEKIKQAWADLNTPRPLPVPDTWLVIHPSTLFVSDIAVSAKTIDLRAGLLGTVRTQTGEPPASSPPPLPDRQPAPVVQNGFNLNVDLALDWATLTAEATKAVQDRSWPLEIAGTTAGTMSLTGAELYPTGEQVAVGLDYVATSPIWETDGRVWLTGTPVLDVDDQSIAIQSFDYVVDDWELSVTGLNAEVVREQLTAQLDGELVFPFQALISEKLTEANAQL